MVEVKLRPGEPIESALRRFKKLVNKSGVLQEVYYRKHYVKPSDKGKYRKLKAWGK